MHGSICIKINCRGLLIIIDCGVSSFGGCGQFQMVSQGARNPTFGNRALGIFLMSPMTGSLEVRNIIYFRLASCSLVGAIQLTKKFVLLWVAWVLPFNMVSAVPEVFCGDRQILGAQQETSS